MCFPVVSSRYTYEVAPLFSLMEQYIMSYVGVNVVGYPDVEKIDGLFNPGITVYLFILLCYVYVVYL